MTVRSSGLIAALSAVIVAACLNAAPATAHSDLRTRIEAITRDIEKSPDAAELYVRRSKVHDQHGDWVAALADLGRAQALGFDPVDVGFFRGRFWLTGKRHAKAVAALTAFANARPDHIGAKLLLARAQAGLGQPDQAEAAQAAAIRLMRSPRPGHYLDLARYAGQAQADDPGAPEARLRRLEEGLEQLGPLTSLVLPVIEIDRQTAQPERALNRLAALPVKLRATPKWLTIRARLLADADRPFESREAYRQSLRALDALPGGRQRTTANLALRREAIAAVMGAGSSDSAN